MAGADTGTEDSENAFDVATETNSRVNEMLAETDGRICTMEYDGAIGYHINVAKGESDPEYLWKIALLQALDETVFEMVYVDADHVGVARQQVERELKDHFNSFTAELVADCFEEKLTKLVETQEDRADEVGGDD